MRRDRRSLPVGRMKNTTATAANTNSATSLIRFIPCRMVRSRPCWKDFETASVSRIDERGGTVPPSESAQPGFCWAAVIRGSLGSNPCGGLRRQFWRRWVHHFGAGEVSPIVYILSRARPDVTPLLADVIVRRHFLLLKAGNRSTMTAMSTIGNMSDIGAAVRQRRRALRMDQATLAVLAGVSRQTVINVEAGKETARADVVLRLLNAVGLELTVG